MSKVQQGFTLIELMVVVAIIGILAAISLPAYSDYQSKAKGAAGLAEISGAKSLFEDIVNNGGTVTAVADIGLAASTQNCTMSVTATTIVCTLRQAPTQVNGNTITWTRTAASGAWTCTTNMATKYAPKSCL